VKKCSVDNIIEQIKLGVEAAEIIRHLEDLNPRQLELTINAIADLKNEKAASVLVLLLEKIEDKGLLKLLKKCLFHLRTRGIHVEEPTRAAGHSVLKRVENERESKALLSNYDPDQTRAVVTAVELRKNEFLFTQAVLHFSKGLVELHSFPVPRKKLDPILAEYQDRTHRPMIVAPVSALYAGYLIEEASRVSGKEVEEAKSLGHLLHSSKGEVGKPADIYSLAVPLGTDPSSLASVLADEIFEAFLLSWAGMEEDRGRLAEAINPSIVLPPHLIQERREALLKDIITERGVTSKSDNLKRMLEDAAYLFHSLKRFDQYGGLIAILENPQSLIAALAYFVQKTLNDLERKAHQQQTPDVLNPHSLIRM
jgi:hypothetical protein